MPRTPISELRQNMSLRQQRFLLREKSLTTTRLDSPMLHVVLGDSTGSIRGVLFDVPTRTIEALAEGRGVEVTGRVGEFRGQAQINIQSIAPAELVNLTEFLPGARRPLAEMLDEFDALQASVVDPDLSRLLTSLFGDSATLRLFSEAPAAKMFHHACVGGLLEHTLSVARFAVTACDVYPELGRDLVVTAAIVHDLGKMKAYDPITFDLTGEGSLWSHLYMGASMVEHAIDRLPGFDPDLRLRLVHAVLAHHGRLENGSPVVPMTLEAMVLHYADNLDGDARGAIDHLARSEADTSTFTERSFMHDTRLYRGERVSPGPQQRSLL